jgi:hypothetical protein
MGFDEVRERDLPVDLHDREELAVARLELLAAGNIHELELEGELGTRLADDLERTRAEAAVGRVVDDDPARYG